MHTNHGFTRSLLFLGVALFLLELGPSARAQDCDEVAEILARYQEAEPWTHPRHDIAVERGWEWRDIVDEARTIGSGHAGTLRSERHLQRMGRAANNHGGPLRYRFALLEDGSIRYVSDTVTMQIKDVYDFDLFHEFLSVDKKLLTQGWMEVTPDGVISLIQDDIFEATQRWGSRFPAGAQSYPTLYEVVTAKGLPVDLTSTDKAIRAATP